MTETSVKHYFIHKSGRIVGIISCNAVEMELNAAAMEVGYVEANGDPEFQWVKDGVLVPRLPASFSVDGLVIKGVPSGASITIGESQYVAEGSDIELSFNYPGTYSVVVDAWPLLPWQCEVTV